MTKRPQSPKGRMIHIRLDEQTHRQLKVHAARQGKTIQQTVEGLIHLNITATVRRNAE
jgi:predicted HicB family RNase H-like nuclease